MARVAMAYGGNFHYASAAAAPLQCSFCWSKNMKDMNFSTAGLRYLHQAVLRRICFSPGDYRHNDLRCFAGQGGKQHQCLAATVSAGQHGVSCTASLVV